MTAADGGELLYEPWLFSTNLYPALLSLHEQHGRQDSKKSGYTGDMQLDGKRHVTLQNHVKDVCWVQASFYIAAVTVFASSRSIVRLLHIMSQSPTKHKVIGLVSGGKDSCFNLMHCVANGHEIVALATLMPEQGIGQCASETLSCAETW